MTKGAPDARWPKLLSLAVHEFRTLITVVAGYIRMLLKERAGPLSEQQRKLLEEAEKSCGRLSALVGEMSTVSGLERNDVQMHRLLELNELLQRAVTALPTMADREVTVELQGAAPGRITADAVRLEGALVSVLTALRREVVTSDRIPPGACGMPRSMACHFCMLRSATNSRSTRSPVPIQPILRRSMNGAAGPD